MSDNKKENLNMDISISIKDYIGNMEGGVTSVLSIIYKDVFYEGIYWYTDTTQVITFPEELEDILDCKVEDYFLFESIKKKLRSEEADYKSIIDSLDSEF